MLHCRTERWLTRSVLPEPLRKSASQQAYGRRGRALLTHPAHRPSAPERTFDVLRRPDIFTCYRHPTAWNLDERLGGPVSCGETAGVFPCRLRIRHGARPCPPAPATPTPLRPTSARSVPARTCLATACACS